ncbi:ABC transporter permease [Candidatus Saccharibacteria bacterium]|nr:ABC transporter permease [Candidatus Saccharibacteria bacterium]MBI3338422.1 ABC transporter permease [Candidatus Saccharibacteria bacterium]
MNHKIITFWRIIKAGTQNFIRNATLAIAAMAVMVVTLSIILFSVIANATLTDTIQKITDKIDISIYLKDDVTEQRRNQLVSDLNKIDNVKSIDFVTKDQALRDFQAANKDDPELLGAVLQTDNYLPASLRIKPKNVDKLEEIKTYIEKPEIKSLQSAKTSYSGDQKEAIDNISKATQFLREGGIAGVIVFAIVSMLIIFNTIRMAIFNRRDELNIMRLLGASSGYIRGPFIVETVIYGIISAVLSVTLCNTLFVVSSSAFQANSFGFLDIQYASDYFIKHFWLILTSQVAVGILIGAVSSIIATRRYLKFKSSK